jgi:sugar transferase (PEP-CTERM system associated)
MPVRTIQADPWILPGGAGECTVTPFRIARPRFLAYFALELGLVVAVVTGLAQVTLALTPSEPDRLPALPVLLTSGLFCAVLFSTQWTALGDAGGLRREVVVFSVVSVVLGLVAFSAIWVLFAPRDRQFPALLVLEGAFAVPAAVALWRWISIRYDLLHAIRERVLILGSGETARQVCRWTVTEHAAEYGVIGFAEETEGHAGAILAMGVRVQTDFASLARFCPGRVDRVVVALEEKRGQLPVRQLMELRLRGIEIEDATSFFERISGKIAVETMLPSWLIFSEGFKTTRLRAVLKRTADLCLSVLLLLLALPAMLLVAVAIKLDSRGPALYRQPRLGRDGREFDVLKFRSMCHGAELETGPTWATRDDPRVTRVGRAIRKLRVDELPQLINVLRGEMSFVGPRPEREHFVRQLAESIPYYGLRMIVRPGITGWAQVQYAYGASEEDALEKLKYDLYYIKNNNLMLDLWIVLKTVRVVLFGKGAR